MAKKRDQVTSICRTEIFTLSPRSGAALVIAQALGDLVGSHITRTPNKPLLLVLLCLVGLEVVGKEKWERDPHESPSTYSQSDC